MRAAAIPRTEVTLGRDTVALRQDELDRLLRALATLEDEAADRALYQAKRDGKDRVVVDGGVVAAGGRDRTVVTPA